MEYKFPTIIIDFTLRSRFEKKMFLDHRNLVGWQKFGHVNRLFRVLHLPGIKPSHILCIWWLIQNSENALVKTNSSMPWGYWKRDEMQFRFYTVNGRPKGAPY